jgi:hypothetical protein
MSDYDKYNSLKRIFLCLLIAVALYDWIIIILLSPIIAVFAIIYFKDWRKYKQSGFKTYEMIWVNEQLLSHRP